MQSSREPIVQSQDQGPLHLVLENEEVIRVEGQNRDLSDDLMISFQRTLRVTDNDHTSPNLRPNLGRFRIYKTDKYPMAFQNNSGVFLPMYQGEAMWIRFQAAHQFAVKIYAGGVNVVSGEPRNENEVTWSRRRLQLAEKKKSLQDYIVTPQQMWLDGAYTHGGKARQFVAMPLGSGYSVEAQVPGSNDVGELQFEVTPALPNAVPRSSNPEETTIRVKADGKESYLFVSGESTGKDIFDAIKAGLNPAQYYEMVSLFQSICANDTIGELQDDAIEVHKYPHVGPGPVPKCYYRVDPSEMVASGIAKQTILRDMSSTDSWDRTKTTRFNLHILNSKAFQSTTGLPPPQDLITAKDYAKHGFPYLDDWDEKYSGIKGRAPKFRHVSEIEAQVKRAERLEELEAEMATLRAAQRKALEDA